MSPRWKQEATDDVNSNNQDLGSDLSKCGGVNCSCRSVSFLCSVHLKIHIPKIIKKHTHVKTVYKHLLQKVPVLEESAEDEYRQGSEKYLRIDPKITLSGGGVTGNELRSLKWASPYSSYPSHSQEVLENSSSAYGNAQPLKTLKRYPKNVQVVHEFQDYPSSAQPHRIVKHMIPTYAIQEDDPQDDYEPSSHEDYAETRPRKSYTRGGSTKTVKFIPASELSQYIPTIPFSSLTAAQSQFKPMWTPSEFRGRDPAGSNQQEHVRSGRSSRYEGTTMRVFSTDRAFSSPRLPHNVYLKRRFQREFN